MVRNLEAWKDVDRVELQWLAGFLVNWEELHPGESLEFGDDCCKVGPINC